MQYFGKMEMVMNDELALRRMFRSLLDTKAKMELTALELMYHPDATPEQLMEVHRTLVKSRQAFEQTIIAAGNKVPWLSRQLPIKFPLLGRGR